MLNFTSRIVKDYEKYIARQLKRGTSRQELNVSWLKKNELDLKRHVVELRDSVRTNWSTTGQELTKELRQYWQSSRPGSPARGVSRPASEVDMDQSSGLKSPAALAHLAHLDIPRPDSPGGNRGPSSDFATGYSLGLIGGVRSWVSLHKFHYICTADPLRKMTRSRTSLRGSQPGSGDSEDESSDAKSPKEEQTPSRGRKSEQADHRSADMMDTSKT